jgi:hypothetical protein
MIMINKLILDTHMEVLVNKATCHPLRRLGVGVIKLQLQDGVGQKKDPAAVHSAATRMEWIQIGLVLVIGYIAHFNTQLITTLYNHCYTQISFLSLS